VLFRSKFEYYLHLAGVYEGLNRYQDALDVLHKQEAKFASEPRLHFRLGILYDKIGDKQKVIASMRQVLSITPADPQALNFLGYTYVEMGENLDEALKLLKDAAALRPNDGFILDSLGWAYFKLKKYTEAVVQLERAVVYVDDDPTILSHLAEAYLAVHDHENAIQTYKKLLQLEPDRKDLLEKIKKIKAESTGK